MDDEVYGTRRGKEIHGELMRSESMDSPTKKSLSM